MLTITQLTKYESGQWHSDNLDYLPDKIMEDAIIWVDAEDPTEQEMNQLKNRFKIDNLNLKELDQEGLRSKITEVEDRVSCFISFPSRDHYTTQIKTNWIALEISKKWMISIHKGYSDITCEIYKKISTHGYFALSLYPSTDILLFIFLDLITNEFFLISDLIHENLQNLGSDAAKLFRQRRKQPTSNIVLEIAKSREQVLTLRQSIGPLREVVGKITRGEFAVVSSSFLPRFEDLYERAISLMDVVDTSREEIHDIGDTLINVQTVTTNNIIRVLTIISAIFLPLTLIAGIYGTDFGRGFFLPGSSSIFGFYVMIAVMIALALSLIFIFRKAGWL